MRQMADLFDVIVLVVKQTHAFFGFEDRTDSEVTAI
jgi:hypothetical protein